MSVEMFFSLFAFLGLVVSWVVLPTTRPRASLGPAQGETEAEGGLL